MSFGRLKNKSMEETKRISKSLCRHFWVTLKSYEKHTYIDGLAQTLMRVPHNFFIRNHKDNKHRNDGGEKTNQVKKTEREKKNQSKKKCWPAENFSNIIFVFFHYFSIRCLSCFHYNMFRLMSLADWCWKKNGFFAFDCPLASNAIHTKTDNREKKNTKIKTEIEEATKDKKDRMNERN